MRRRQASLLHPFHCWSYSPVYLSLSLMSVMCWYGPSRGLFLLLFPFHCWSTVPAQVRVNVSYVLRVGPGPIGGPLLHTRFTVGRHSCDARLSTLMSVMGLPWALGRGNSSPVSLLENCSYVARLSTLVKKEGSPWGYSLGSGHPCDHPFHCWSTVSHIPDDHFLSRNTRNL